MLFPCSGSNVPVVGTHAASVVSNLSVQPRGKAALATCICRHTHTNDCCAPVSARALPLFQGAAQRVEKERSAESVKFATH